MKKPSRLPFHQNTCYEQHTFPDARDIETARHAVAALERLKAVAEKNLDDEAAHSLGKAIAGIREALS
jgi:hypothetical protein